MPPIRQVRLRAQRTSFYARSHGKRPLTMPENERRPQRSIGRKEAQKKTSDFCAFLRMAVAIPFGRTLVAFGAAVSG